MLRKEVVIRWRCDSCIVVCIAVFLLTEFAYRVMVYVTSLFENVH